MFVIAECTISWKVFFNEVIGKVVGTIRHRTMTKSGIRASNFTEGTEDTDNDLI